MTTGMGGLNFNLTNFRSDVAFHYFTSPSFSAGGLTLYQSDTHPSISPAYTSVPTLRCLIDAFLCFAARYYTGLYKNMLVATGPNNVTFIRPNEPLKPRMLPVGKVEDLFTR